MPHRTAKDLEAFVAQLAPEAMVDLLLEFAHEHEAVRQRLIRLRLADDPKRLAAGFRKSLSAWKRASKFLGYREAREFSAALQEWLAQIERELLPKDPPAALALLEAFIEADTSFFERADDSDGAIGDVVGAACSLWLDAAAQCESPADEWPARLDALAAADEYGAREGLYRHADRLLDAAALRALVQRHMAQLQAAVAAPGAETRLPAAVYRSSGTLTLLSRALRDPDVHVAAVRVYSPQPNPNQIEAFVREYLEFGRPADALGWLEPPWGGLEDARERLLAQALALLGRGVEAAAVSKHIFERTLASADLHRWLEPLPLAERAAAIDHARTLAKARSDEPVTAAQLLVETGDHRLAEDALLAAAQRIDGGSYSRLLPLAQSLESAERWVGATAVYRALLDAILARAYAPAYRHGARYWERLEWIASRGVDLGALGPHAVYVADIRKKHARKSSFWSCVQSRAARGAVAAAEADTGDACRPQPLESQPSLRRRGTGPS